MEPPLTVKTRIFSEVLAEMAEKVAKTLLFCIHGRESHMSRKTGMEAVEVAAVASMARGSR